MPNTIDYGRPSPRVRSLPILAFAVGLSSGPVAQCLAGLATANQLPEPTKERLMLWTLIAVFGGAIVLSCVVRLTLPSTAPRRYRLFANAAIVASIVWTVLIFALDIVAAGWD